MNDYFRLRAGLAVVKNSKILLLPHYNTDTGPIQWNIPAGKVEFGEALETAAAREFEEETGLVARVIGLLNISEVILPERPWHSVTIIYSGEIIGGQVAAEADHGYGVKVPRWMSWDALQGTSYHPPETVRKALGI